MPRSMTFRVDDQSSGGLQPAIWVTLVELDNGTVQMSVRIEGDVVGDLRGVFFDVADERLIGSIATSKPTFMSNDDPPKILPPSTPYSLVQGNNTVRDAGKDATMNGMLGSDGGYDVGLSLGSSGIGKDDIGSMTTILSSSMRALTLDDFANVDFGVRTTSVGMEGGGRNGSSKLFETTFTAINALDDSAAVNEDDSVTGDLLANDRSGLAAGDTVTVTQWSGGTLGETITLANTAGATLTVNGDGTYLLDANASDALSAGESFTFEYTYSARNVHEATASATDSAKFTVTVYGVNDGPEAMDDDAGTIAEGESASGNVLTNDTDVDRLDVLRVTGILDGNGQPVLGDTVTLDSDATVQIAADGTYHYITGHAFDSLLAGQTATDTFTYQIADGHGGYDTATVTVRIEGRGTVDPGGGGGGGGGDEENSFDFPTMDQRLSNVVCYLKVGTEVEKVKISVAEGDSVMDIDVLNLPGFITSFFPSGTQLLAASIHAGKEYPNDSDMDGTANGEGAFFWLGDGRQIQAIGDRLNRWEPDWSKDDYDNSTQAPIQAALDAGITAELLLDHVEEQYTFTASESNGVWIIS